MDVFIAGERETTAGLILEPESREGETWCGEAAAEEDHRSRDEELKIQLKILYICSLGDTQ